MAGRLGDILVRRGNISQQQLESALHSQGSERGRLGMVMLRRGLITLDQLGGALSEQFEVPYQEVVGQAINPQIVRLLPESFARDRSAVPIAIENGRLRLAMNAPDDIETIAEAELITGYRVDPVVALDHDVQTALDCGFDERIVARQTIVDMKLAELTEREDQNENELVSIANEEESAPVVKLVRAILMGAINAGTSDIHVEPHEPEMRVRYRVDGQMQQVMTIPNNIEEAVVARIKVMADMDTTENRRPQDGHLAVDEDDTKVNFRVSTIPTVAGEKVVLRLLDESNKIVELDKIGFSPENLEIMKRLIDKPHGMIVVTGPTGSGKSTTLYAVLSSLNKVHRNIVTVEDPVEFRITGINQVQSDNEFGLGFANALKYIMRQDPDVIMVGEIRDHETAATSIQAALTGHLLLTTLHTNDAVGSVSRLNDLGIDPFKIGGSLLGSVAQRLLRSICLECKEPVQPSKHMLSVFGEYGRITPDDTFYRGRGCKKCLGTGFSGRIAIFEIMEVTQPIAEAIELGLPHSKLRDIALREGMCELAESGLNRAIAGDTTLEEVFYKTSG